MSSRTASKRRSRRRSKATVVVVAVAVLAVASGGAYVAMHRSNLLSKLPWAAAPTPAASAAASKIARNGPCSAATPAPGLPSAGDPSSGPAPAAGVPCPSKADKAAADRQAALVTAEDHRLVETFSVALAAPLQGAAWRSPYHLDTGSGRTLVLTPRDAPYTVDDLARLAPTTFVRQRDGSYLVSENIFVSAGAKLVLASPRGMTLRLASTKRGFVSIVSFEGSLTLAGSDRAPLRVGSWDPGRHRLDTDVTDGRAYIRAIGGQFTMDHVVASALGFWSGRTGGISLTGTDRPADSTTRSEAESNKGMIRRLARQTLPTATAPGGAPSTAGATGSGSVRIPVPSSPYVTGKITDSRIVGNAYGLFVSKASSIVISGTRVEKSLNDGVVLHRFTSRGVVQRTTSVGNAGTGFVVARGAHDIHITQASALGNGLNGFFLNGQPLADGPSPAGESVDSYGSNVVSSSLARDNANFGVEVIGGVDVQIQRNKIEGSQMGIVARGNAKQVKIVDNRVSGQRRQGIAVRDGVTAATVTGNAVDDASTGIYVRDSVAAVQDNTVYGATLHGVTLVGSVRGSYAAGNLIKGRGPSAIDVLRAHGGVKLAGNRIGGWRQTRSLWVDVRRLARPMTVVWTVVILLVVLSAAARGARRRGVHPYERQKPLEQRPAPTMPMEVVRSADKANGQQNGQQHAKPQEQPSERLEVLAE